MTCRWLGLSRPASDGGLVAVVVLTWLGTPVGWLRQLVRVLSAVAANAVSGWPDPVATGLHAAAPLMLVAMIEAGRTVLMRRVDQERGTAREPIPLVRWALASWRTLLLWRAVHLLRVRYGRHWRRRAPADLVWMLRTSVGVEEVCTRLCALVGADDALGTAEAMASARTPQAGLGVSGEQPWVFQRILRRQ